MNVTAYGFFLLLAFLSIIFSFQNDQRQNLPGEWEKWIWVSIFRNFFVIFRVFLKILNNKTNTSTGEAYMLALSGN